jgi:uncharacterized protein YcaQ
VRARKAAHAVVKRFGYLQLDTVSIAGARSHAIVLLSRLGGLDPVLCEELLQPGEPIFEYWGHEASWLPIELYPVFEFRRQEFRHHPWWGDVVGENPELANTLRRRIRNDGPIRSTDMEGPGGRGWWDLKMTKRVATALWSSGELAIRERRNFQRLYDLAERVIPEELRSCPLRKADALERLVLKALDGHGWATTGTIASTWRLTNRREELLRALARLEGLGSVLSCDLENPGGRATPGWIRSEDLELAARLETVRPRRDRGVLLSPFDPLLWDRPRVKRLFDFEAVLEVFKPAAKRRYGYFCLPVLAGERLVARVDLKAEREAGVLRVLSRHIEDPKSLCDVEATRVAVGRYAEALQLRPVG